MIMKVKKKRKKRNAERKATVIRHSTPIKIISALFWQTATDIILLVIATCQYQKLAFALPPVYTSVRHQVPSRESVPVVASSLPLAILSDPSLATRTSMQGSIFASPYENVKRSPQNDAQIVAAVGGSTRRTARHIRVYRLTNANAMDRAISSHGSTVGSINPESARYELVDVELLNRWIQLRWIPATNSL